MSGSAPPRGRLDGRFAAARGVADAVCYEGYVLYPYRASAGKNRVRWQFGVLVPPSAAAAGSESACARAEVVVETRAGAVVHVRLRALQVQQRSVEEVLPGGGFRPVESLDEGGRMWTSFDEVVEVEADLEGVGAASAGVRVLDVTLPAGEEHEAIVDAGGEIRGRVVRRRRQVSARLRVTVSPLEGPYPLSRITLEAENTTGAACDGLPREVALRHSLVAAHLLVAVDSGRPLSSLDPPRFAADAVGGCANRGLFPVLVGDGGDGDVVLASPIILYDHPAVAPESRGDMFDATEIDEILALRVLTLTEEEKREARGTDPRAAAIIDRCDALGADALGALHGTFRSVRQLGLPVREAGPDRPAGSSRGGPGENLPWWEPAVDAAFDPWNDTAEVGGDRVGRGTRVRLHPGRRADAQDVFVDGREATVAGVFHDVGGDIYLAVAVDDPDADLHQWHGRYLYFHPDEVEVLGAVAGGGKVLVAGVGNIFFGDDGFGVEVVRSIDPASVPAGVKVADFGIGGVHLAYELLEGYRTLVLVDAVSRGDPPGTVSIIEHDPAGGTEGGSLAAMDAHGMDPAAVLAMAGDMGARVERVLVVACEAAGAGEGIGLSPPVAGAVPHAVQAVHQLLESLHKEAST